MRYGEMNDSELSQIGDWYGKLTPRDHAQARMLARVLSGNSEFDVSVTLGCGIQSVRCELPLSDEEPF